MSRLQVVAAAVVIVGGLFTFWDRIFGPHPRLEGVFTVSVHEEPPSNRQAMEELNEAISQLRRDISEILSEHDELTPDTRSRMFYHLGGALDTLRDTHRDRRFRSEPNGFAYGTVSNAGSVTLENVQLRIPYVVEAQYAIDDKTTTMQRQPGGIPVITLGTMPPGTQVSIYVWTRISLSFRPRIQLVHRDGIGVVTVE